jgi:TPR repeat protein
MRKFLVPVLLMLTAAAAQGASLDDARAAVRIQDYAKAAEIYRTLADAGDPEARYHLATLYRSGLGVDADPVASRELLELAAVQGYANAQYAWAQLLEKDSGTRADPGAASEWYRKAAEQNHRLAAERLRFLVTAAPAGAALTPDELCHAASRGDVAAIRSAAGSTANINAVGTRGRTALMKRSSRGQRLWMPDCGVPMSANAMGNLPCILPFVMAPV